MRSWMWMAGACLLATACGSPAPLAEVDDPQRAAAAAAAPPVLGIDRLQAQIRSVRYDGELCPASTVVTTTSPDAVAWQSLFSQPLGAGDQPASQLCLVTLELALPDGYQMGDPRFILRGAATDASLRRVYGFVGNGGQRSLVDAALPESFVRVDRADGVWSPGCGGTRQLVAAIFPTVAPHGFFALDSLGGDNSWRGGTDWRRCGERDPVVAPPGRVGDFCAGPHQRACAAGLGCEFDGHREPDSEGACVDPRAKLPPAGRGERCGGLRGIACAGGLVCYHGSQKAVDERWLGRCTPAVSGPGDPCDVGVPALHCTPGLWCLHGAGASTCVAADGSLHSPCGDGLPACRDGLRCNGTECVPPRVP